MKFVTFLLCFASTLVAADNRCEERLKIKLTPDRRGPNDIRDDIPNLRIDVDMFTPNSYEMGGPRGGWNRNCRLSCNALEHGWTLNATKSLQKTCNTYHDRRFDDVPNYSEMQWYISDLTLGDGATPDRFNVTSMTIMIKHDVYPM
jgi:hypothetical protein